MHCDGKVNNGGLGRHLGRVGRVGEFCGHVQHESRHDVALFISDDDLKGDFTFDFFFGTTIKYPKHSKLK